MPAPDSAGAVQGPPELPEERLRRSRVSRLDGVRMKHRGSATIPLMRVPAGTDMGGGGVAHQALQAKKSGTAERRHRARFKPPARVAVSLTQSGHMGRHVLPRSPDRMEKPQAPDEVGLIPSVYPH